MSELGPWKLAKVSPAKSQSQYTQLALSVSAPVESAVTVQLPSSALCESCWALTPSLSGLPPPTQSLPDLCFVSGGSNFPVPQLLCPSTTVISPILNNEIGISC